MSTWRRLALPSFPRGISSRSRRSPIDITERKRAEEKEKQLLAEVKRSNEELEQFAYVASHDLQEPLAHGRRATTQLLARRYQGQLDADADEFIGFAVDGADRMQTLINDLLAYSRVGTRGKDFAPTDFAAVLDHALDQSQVGHRRERRRRHPRPAADRSWPTSLQIGQLFQNLIGNAIKYRGAEPPRVHVSAEPTGNDGEWIFSVRDNGIGIDPQYAERIFVIFQRLHTRDEYPGTGIGLAICKKIVERHGGRIWVESQVGKRSHVLLHDPDGRGRSDHERCRDRTKARRNPAGRRQPRSTSA